MSNFSIAITGFNAAQRGLDVVANNIANSATEGYHYQRIKFAPAYSSQSGSSSVGGGVKVTGVTRMIDSLLEREIIRQKSLFEQIYQELGTLRTVENAFGALSTEGGGLEAAIDKFFNSLSQLTADPGGTIYQEQAVSDGENMAGQFRVLGEFFSTLDAQIILEAENITARINELTGQIAEFNGNIERLELGGKQVNSLRDQRDMYITQLSELVAVQTIDRASGVVDVIIGRTPVVTGASATEVEVGLNEQDKLGISVTGVYNYSTDLQGGRLGGLFSLRNELVADVTGDLDDLADTIIQQINQYHVQGVGSQGSFDELSGWAMASADLADLGSNVTDGSIYIRLINSSGASPVITRHEIPVDKSDDSLDDIKTAISAIDGLTASVSASKQLTITADTDYKFDFLPGVLSEPTTSTLSGTAEVEISGIYTGTEEKTYTCTVINNGEVGITDGLKIKVEVDGVEITTVNVGSGYAAGDRLEIDEKIFIALGAGNLVDGETFTIQALANSDTSGLLSAAGMNTFFSGSSAADMAVSSDIVASPDRIATSLGPDMDDNANAERLKDLRGEEISDLSDMTIGQFYRRLVTDIGQKISIRQMRKDNIEVMVQNLLNQQNQISGVDINEQVTQMLVFEQMFQAMAKYLSTIQSSITAIMQLI